MNANLPPASLSFTRIWHCFGNHTNKVGLEIIEGLLDISGTNGLAINTHRLTPGSGRKGLEIGFGGVTYDELAARRDLTWMTKLLNINLQTTSQAAFDKTKLAVELTGERVIKLEVLDEGLRKSNDQGVVEAVRLLHDWNEHLVIMPLLSSNLATAKALIDLGCPLLRIMGSPIGSCAGIADPQAFRQICELGVPIVMDGGVGSSAHFYEAISMGASGVLVNSMLFASSLSPIAVMRSFVVDCAKILQSTNQTTVFTLPARESKTHPTGLPAIEYSGRPMS